MEALALQRARLYYHRLLDVSTRSLAEAPRHVLPVIVIAQFAGTSMWFAGNAVVGDLARDIGVSFGAVGVITTAVQLGFIAGTLVYAVALVADRFSPSRVFLVSAVLGALFVLVTTLYALARLTVANFRAAGTSGAGVEMVNGISCAVLIALAIYLVIRAMAAVGIGGLTRRPAVSA